ncbi:MAG TPA: DUF1684 domain-containing protein [Acidimicrobiales bacterium]|nr:DUF1684 domain-containing protein [Acidimicrobiales bacterium]
MDGYGAGPGTSPPTLSLLDWRRQVGALYARIRGSGDIRAAHELWRTTRDRLLAEHPQSPVPAERRESFRGVPVAPYDPAYRFDIALDATTRRERIEVVTGTDETVSFERLGVVELGGIGSLDVWWLLGYGGGIFVPVRDALAGTATYGGGRYVLDTVKGADLGGDDGRLVVDLNFAYNPSCAYDPAWSCPLAPPGNVVSVPLGVGELTA